MSNLIVVRSDVEVQALKQTGSVNAEDMGHTGEIREGTKIIKRVSPARLKTLEAIARISNKEIRYFQFRMVVTTTTAKI